MGGYATLKRPYSRGVFADQHTAWLNFPTLLPLMADGGRIVNVSSGLTRFALPGYSFFAAMKGAMEVLTRHMDKELGPRSSMSSLHRRLRWAARAMRMIWAR